MRMLKKEAESLVHKSIEYNSKAPSVQPSKWSSNVISQAISSSKHHKAPLKITKFQCVNYKNIFLLLHQVRIRNFANSLATTFNNAKYFRLLRYSCFSINQTLTLTFISQRISVLSISAHSYKPGEIIAVKFIFWRLTTVSQLHKNAINQLKQEAVESGSPLKGRSEKWQINIHFNHNVIAIN